MTPDDYAKVAYQAGIGVAIVAVLAWLGLFDGSGEVGFTLLGILIFVWGSANSAEQAGREAEARKEYELQQEMRKREEDKKRFNLPL